MPSRATRAVERRTNENLEAPIDRQVNFNPDPERGPPEGRIPFGESGWYHTPEVVDPQDCVNYPDSPWCGGNPFDNPFKSSPFSLSVEVNIHRCGLDVDVSGTIFWTKTPVHGVSYRREGDCRNEPEDPPSPPPPKGLIRTPVPFDEGNVVAKDSDVIFCVVTEVTYGMDTKTDAEQSYVENELTGIRFPGTKPPNKATEGDTPPNTASGISLFDVQTDYDGAWRGLWNGVRGDFNTPDGFLLYRILRGSWEFYPYYWAIKAPWGKIKEHYSSYSVNGCNEYEDVDKQGYPNGKYYFSNVGRYAKVLWSNTYKDKTKYPPPPLDPPRKCCMQCCSDQGQQNDNTALLQQILAEVQKANKNLGTYPFNVTLFDADENKQEAQSKTIAINNVANGIKNTIDRVEKTSKMIGIDAFPITLPDTIIEQADSGLLGDALNFLNPFKNRTINSIAELVAWKIEQDSAVLGHWQQFIEMEVSTTDPKTGKTSSKKEKVVLPNISETMTEILRVNTQGTKIIGLILDCCIKLLIDVGGTKLKAAEAAKRAEDIQQYLDYPTIEKWMDVPLQTDMPRKDDPQEKRENLHQFLQPSQAKVKFDDWTGEHSFQEAVIDLLNAARTIQAVYFSGQ
jgi:hypothetical protein